MKNQKTLQFELKYAQHDRIPLRELLKTAAQLSGRSLRQYFFKGLIRINRRQAHSAAMVNYGDLVQVFGLTEHSETLQPEAEPIAVVYEDPQLLIINKPALLPVHPSGAITSGTLAHRVAYYLQEKGLKIKVRPVNRLDYGTSGLIIFAKSAPVQEQVSSAIGQHRIARIYYAIVAGTPAADAGIINQPIACIRGERKVSSSGQPAVTHYRVMERFSGAALLELSLHSGRTHQIRIHLQYLGTPILGDPKYGGKSPLIGRPALHAGKLRFDDSSGFGLPELTAPLPDDMLELIAKLQ